MGRHDRSVASYEPTWWLRPEWSVRRAAVNNKECSLSRAEESRPSAEGEADMITVIIPVQRCVAASQWFAENHFNLVEPEEGVAPNRAAAGPMRTHAKGIDIPYNFHPSDSAAAMLFKLAWGGK